MIDTTILLIAAATALDGVATGASLDQTIKQLPARHRIGVVAFSAYNRAADRGTGGLVLYAGAGVVDLYSRLWWQPWHFSSR